jgi:predicted nucleic acid-binding protein
LTDYLLDTNVVSELVRPNPDANLVKRVRAGDETRFHLSVLTFGEIRQRVERLPFGPRRERLRCWLEIDLTDRFQGRILDIDRRVTEIWGMIMARGAAASVGLPSVVTLIAATAERHGMVVVTRNLRDFAFAAVAAVNPWAPANPTSQRG